MNAKLVRILLVEDNPGDARLLREAIKEVGSAQFELVHVERLSEALKRLDEQRFDIILLDLSLPDGKGLETVVRVHTQVTGVPIVVLTGLDDEAVALDAVRAGAQDYLVKGQVDGNLLVRAMRYAIERKQAEEKIERNLERIRALHEIDLAITSTLDLRAVLDVLLEKIDLVLPYSVTTVRLLNKETGKLEPVACRNINEEEWRTAINGADKTLARALPDIKAPLMIRNAQTDPRSVAPDILRKHGLVSALRVPLIAKGEALGVLTFFTKEEHEFSDEVEFLSTLAGQAAIAIHNAQLYEEINASKRELELANRYLERSLKQLSSLYTALTPLTSGESAHEMMDGIIERLMEATGADAALIRIQDEVSGALSLASQRGFPDHYVRTVETAPPGSGSDLVFKTGEIIIAADIAKEPRLRGKIQLQVGLRSCAMLPLKVHDEVRGIIHLACRQLGYFDEEQKEHLMAIARQMGIALENKELFDSLRTSRDELAKANKVKDEFLSVMSHEMRTPLNVVLGYTGMLKDGLLGEITPKQDEALGKVLSRVNDQLAMINNVLFATVIEASRIPVERQVVLLGELFNEMESLFHGLSTGPDVAFISSCPPELPVLETDRAKLKNVLQNLIGNAIKFTETGTITLSARHNPENRTIEISVSDTGIGIPQEMIPAVWEKFRQVDSSETRIYGGTGIGLHIVKKFSEMLGGKADVESELGKGSTFVVTLPLDPAMHLSLAKRK